MKRSCANVAASPWWIGRDQTRPLSERIRYAAARSEPQEFNYRDKKKSDWPAFRTSGLKTLKLFEERYIAYDVRGANEANIMWQIVSRKFPNEAELASASSAGTKPTDLGTWMLGFHRFNLDVWAKLFGS